jgi:hypothetical protein
MDFLTNAVPSLSGHREVKPSFVNLPIRIALRDPDTAIKE